MHESKTHRDNCYITLTYDDKNLPVNGSLNLCDMRNFWKRFRKSISPNTVRYFQVGEYGDEGNRPHHHACVFGYEFPDQVPIGNSGTDKPMFTSALLSKLWGKGRCTVQLLNYASAAYVARYNLKKINGIGAKGHYERVDSNGELTINLKPEYATMSRRPGIGAKFYERYKTDIFPSDQVVINGKIQSPPSFYLRLLEKENPEMLATIKKNRQLKADLHEEDQTDSRLLTRETVKHAQIKSLTRK